MQFTVPLSGPNAVQVSQVEETITYPTDFCQVVSVPTSATALQLYAGFVSGTGSLLARVIGESSGTDYSDGFTAVPNQGLTVPINTAIDTSFQVCWEETPGNSGRWVLTIAALLSAVGAGTSVNVTCNCGGSGGAMLAYGIYTALNPLGGTWTKVVEVGAAMLQADNATFDLPAGSTAIVGVEVSVIPTNAALAFLYDLSITTSETTFGLDVGDDEVVSGVNARLAGAFTAVIDANSDPSFSAAVGGGSGNVSFTYGPTLVIAAWTRP